MEPPPGPVPCPDRELSRDLLALVDAEPLAPGNGLFVEIPIHCRGRAPGTLALGASSVDTAVLGTAPRAASWSLPCHLPLSTGSPGARGGLPAWAPLPAAGRCAPRQVGVSGAPWRGQEPEHWLSYNSLPRRRSWAQSRLGRNRLRNAGWRLPVPPVPLGEPGNRGLFLWKHWLRWD
uniref:Uncharacterized protein n=1 Tax=Myotis myotis TaxID=51298 RepID=A0A7J7UD19_MYOMY|nr:hypothetical protein mMyoMyo1_008809 [Myotis myotis]